MGPPGFVLNEYGRGKAFYSSILLGTAYEGSGTDYEWDSTHSGMSVGRILGAFLKYAGVKPGCEVTGLAERVRMKLRIESPIVSSDGNAVIGMTSFNDDAVGPFTLELELPANARGPFTRVFAVTEGSRLLRPVDAKVRGSRLIVHMPRFDTHAAIIAVKNAAPLVSLNLKGVSRGIAGLAELSPNKTFEVEAIVYNPSSRNLSAGEVSLAIPAGWLQSAEKIKVGAIKAGGEARCVFRVRTSGVAGITDTRPLLVRYQNGSIKSTPATEMVWWGPEKQGFTK